MGCGGNEALLLDHVEQLLYDMQALAEKAARDECTDEERARLQKGMELLKNVLDFTVDQYETLPPLPGGSK